MKNKPLPHQHVSTKIFQDYNNLFLKIFLDDFILFNSMDIHLDKLQIFFLKCHEFGIGLNPKQCAFVMFYGLIIKFIVPRKGKILNPKKIPTTLAQIQVFNYMTQFYKEYGYSIG